MRKEGHRVAAKDSEEDQDGDKQEERRSQTLRWTKNSLMLNMVQRFTKKACNDQASTTRRMGAQENAMAVNGKCGCE